MVSAVLVSSGMGLTPSCRILRSWPPATRFCYAPPCLIPSHIPNSMRTYYDNSYVIQV